MPLKQLSKFWRSHEKPWIICKVELKLKWTNCSDLSANGNYNTDGDRNGIIFTIKDTKSYVPVVMLSAKDNQILSKVLSKRFERSVYWNEYARKNENKNKTKEHIYFLRSMQVLIDCFFWLIFYYLSICIIKIITSLSLERTFVINPFILV